MDRRGHLTYDFPGGLEERPWVLEVQWDPLHRGFHHSQAPVQGHQSRHFRDAQVEASGSQGIQQRSLPPDLLVEIGGDIVPGQQADVVSRQIFRIWLEVHPGNVAPAV